ncbi:MAG: hypothetical protein ACE5HD_08970 [Acidobacteriota bacterium]
MAGHGLLSAAAHPGSGDGRPIVLARRRIVQPDRRLPPARGDENPDR